MAGRGGGRGGGRGNGRGGRGQAGGRGGGGGGGARRVVAVVQAAPAKKLGTLDARFTLLNKRRAEQTQRGATNRYAATMAKRTGQSAKKFAAKPVSVAGKGKNSAAAKKKLAAKKGIAVGKKGKNGVAKAKLASAPGATKKGPKKKKKPAREAKPTTPAKKAPKKAPKKKAPKKAKPEKPTYTAGDLDMELESYMAAAPAGDPVPAA